MTVSGRRNLVAVLAGGVLLASCQTLGGSAPTVHKAGSTLEQRRAVIDTCQVQALEEVPVAYQVRIHDTFSFGYPGYCRGGYYSCYPGRVYAQNYDPDERLRARRFNACLRDKGYALVTLPRCTSEADIQDYKSKSRQPSLGRLKCVSGEPSLQSRWTRQ
ncbi:hypothetical protein [Roseibium sp.]|uniref:hypothetical protein n=1 Tax=Roseibium sp. TaxID=1936156 RepID=UPI003A987419